jgi:hypothetical protein
MKRTFIKNIVNASLLIAALALPFNSCQKDSDGSPEVKPGTPVLESMTPDSAQGGALLILKGTGLGDMRSILFEKDSIPAGFLSTLNTETVLMFRVPTDAAGGEQNIIFTNSLNKSLSVPFRVLAYPQVNSVSNYDFETGSQITLTGYNLNDVTKVVLTGTTDEATIISKTKTQLVVEMPATAEFRATLSITNVTGTKATTQEFVSIPNNFIMYADAYGPGAYNAGIQSWSFGCNVSESSTEAKTGTKSLKVDYADGGLSLFLGSDTWADGHWFSDFFTPTYLTFWAKAVGSNVDLKIVPDSPPWSGWATGQTMVNVPKDVWTYFKIPTTFISGSFGRLDIVIQNAVGKTVYFDDLLFVK